VAKLYIAEYESRFLLDGAKGGFVQVAPQPPLAEQTVNITAGSLQSAAFNLRTRYIRVHTDATCSILVGADPTATTSKQRVAADHPGEYFGVMGGHKIAVIVNS
jgi:hypothetical protein